MMQIFPKSNNDLLQNWFLKFRKLLWAPPCFQRKPCNTFLKEKCPERHQLQHPELILAENLQSLGLKGWLNARQHCVKVKDYCWKELGWVNPRRPTAKVGFSEHRVPVWLCLSYRKGRVHGSPEATGQWGMALWWRPRKKPVEWHLNSSPVIWIFLL